MMLPAGHGFRLLIIGAEPFGGQILPFPDIAQEKNPSVPHSLAGSPFSRTRHSSRRIYAGRFHYAVTNVLVRLAGFLMEWPGCLIMPPIRGQRCATKARKGGQQWPTESNVCWPYPIKESHRRKILCSQSMKKRKTKFRFSNNAWKWH